MKILPPPLTNYGYMLSTALFIVLLFSLPTLHAQLYCGSTQTCANNVGIGAPNTGVLGLSFGLTVQNQVSSGGGLYVENSSTATTALGIFTGSANGTGVFSTSSTGISLYGLSTSGTGLYGETTSGSAVFGKTTGSGWAGRFEGNVWMEDDVEVDGVIHANGGIDLSSLTVEAAPGFQLGVAHFKVGTARQVFVTPNLGAGNFNFLSQAGDMGIFFSDGAATGDQNQSAGLVLAPWTGTWAKGIRIDANGKVGIGIAVPKADLDVDGDVFMEGPVGIGVDQPQATLHMEGDLIIQDPATGDNEIHLKEDGNIICRQLDVSPMPIPDYVFDENYQLMPLSQFREFIETHHHLPGIKSADEYEQIGQINVGELSVQLLEKVEELSLYILELEEKLRKLELQAEGSSTDTQLPKHD